MMSDFQGLLGLLTRLPVGGAGDEGFCLKRAVWGLPFAGLLVGGFAALVFLLFAGAGLPPALCVIPGLMAGVLVTGALHEDGLADFCDGLGVQGKDKILKVMRDSQIGSFGVIGLCFTILWRALALYELARLGHGAAAFLLMHMVGRGVLPLLMFLPLADETGLAHRVLKQNPEDGAKIYDRPLSGPPFDWRVGPLVGLLFSLAVMLLVAGWLASFGLAVVIILTAAGAAAFAGWLALQRIGGMSGDVYGAAEQVAEMAVLAVLLGFLS